MTRVLLVSHYTSTPGTYDSLALYLRDKGYELSSILHPLESSEHLPSRIETPLTAVSFRIPRFLQYVLEGPSVLFHVMRHRSLKHFSLAICFDPLSFFHTLLLKRFLGIKKIVYYNVDFSTKRFSLGILNTVYQLLNRFALNACDYCLCLTENFITTLDPHGSKRSKTFLVRHITDVVAPVAGLKTHKKRDSIIFIGTLSNTVDFLDVLTAAKRTAGNIKRRILFDIYGEGTNSSTVRELIQRLGCQDIVRLHGVVSREQLLRTILPHYMIGVAPYVLSGRPDSPDHLFQGTDLTTKVVDYISCGLPVVSTLLYSAFSAIETHSFGFLVRTVDDWERAFTALLTDNDLRDRYSEHALQYAQQYHPDTVLGPVLKKMLEE